jgi:hypothetical protein
VKELSNIQAKINKIYTSPNPVPAGAWQDNARWHGTCMIAKAAGKSIGIARNVDAVYVTMIPYERYISENFLDGLMKIYDDIAATPGKASKSIINMSVLWYNNQISLQWKNKLGT